MGTKMIAKRDLRIGNKVVAFKGGYIGQTPRLEKNQWTGAISLWFGNKKVWDSRTDAHKESVAS